MLSIAVRHFGFLKLEILTDSTVVRTNFRHRAKFRVDWSNCCGDMAIFRFFQNGGRKPYWTSFMRFWATHVSIWWSLSLFKIWLDSVQARMTMTVTTTYPNNEGISRKGYSSSFFFPSFTISSSSRVILRLTNGNIRTSKEANQSSTKQYNKKSSYVEMYCLHIPCTSGKKHK